MSKVAVEAMPTEEINETHTDNKLCYAIWKDQFKLGAKVHNIPCNHLYHSNCILQWFQLCNSYPIFHHELPTTIDGDKGAKTRHELEEVERIDIFQWLTQRWNEQPSTSKVAVEAMPTDQFKLGAKVHNILFNTIPTAYSYGFNYEFCALFSTTNCPLPLMVMKEPKSDGSQLTGFQKELKEAERIEIFQSFTRKWAMVLVGEGCHRRFH
ncbi:hypothetical protein Gotur_007168, partial [Gossypium turneri]